MSNAAAELIRQGLLRRACEAVAAFENAHDDPEWEAHRMSHGLS